MRTWLRDPAAARLAAPVAPRAATPLATLLSIGVLALALVLPLVGFASWSGLARIAARLRHRSADRGLPARRKPRPGIGRRSSAWCAPGRASSAVRTVTKEQALAELQATEGVRDLLAGLAGQSACPTRW